MPDRFRLGAVRGAVAASLLGLRDALGGRPDREEAALVVDAPTAPPAPDVDVALDPDFPELTIVVVRRRGEPPGPDGS